MATFQYPFTPAVTRTSYFTATANGGFPRYAYNIDPLYEGYQVPAGATATGRRYNISDIDAMNSLVEGFLGGGKKLQYDIKAPVRTERIANNNREFNSGSSSSEVYLEKVDSIKKDVIATPINPYSRGHLDFLSNVYGSEKSSDMKIQIDKLLSKSKEYTINPKGTNYLGKEYVPQRDATVADYAMFEGTPEQLFLSGRTKEEVSSITRDNPFDLSWLIKSQLARWDSSPNTKSYSDMYRMADATGEYASRGGQDGVIKSKYFHFNDIFTTWENAPDTLIQSEIANLEKQIRAAGVNPEFLSGTEESRQYLGNKTIDRSLPKTRPRSQLNQSRTRTPTYTDPRGILGGSTTTKKTLLGG